MMDWILQKKQKKKYDGLKIVGPVPVPWVALATKPIRNNIARKLQDHITE